MGMEHINCSKPFGNTFKTTPICALYLSFFGQKVISKKIEEYIIFGYGEKKGDRQKSSTASRSTPITVEDQFAIAILP